MKYKPPRLVPIFFLLFYSTRAPGSATGFTMENRTRMSKHFLFAIALEINCHSSLDLYPNFTAHVQLLFFSGGLH